MVTIERLASVVPDASVYGNRSHKVAGIVDFSALNSEHELLFLANRKLVEKLPDSGAPKACSIVDRKIWETSEDRLSKALSAAIITARPRFALARVSSFFPRQGAPEARIHPSANIDPSAQIGPGCSIGPGVNIGCEVSIGARSTIGPNVTIAAGTALGESCRVGAGVFIADGVNIGSRVLIHANAVIGSDGFSFETEGQSPAERAKAGGSSNHSGVQPWERIESFGSVELGDDVEIGACTTIDRAAFGETVVGRGTKIDNLVQIGHNCRIGEDTLLCAQVGIAGSSVVGSGCILAGKVGVADHLKIGDSVVVMAKSGVTKNLAAGAVYCGMPARPVKDTLRIYSLVAKLGDMRKRLAEAEKLLGGR